MHKLLLCVLFMFALATSPVVCAAGPATPDKTAEQVKRVVQLQLKAFAADDAKGAFALAADALQQIFGSPDQFMEMVRQSYPVVYRPSSVAFYKPTPDGTAMTQRVAMTDDQGTAWIAVYRLEQQKNKTWRIAGCVLIPDTSQKA